MNDLAALASLPLIAGLLLAAPPAAAQAPAPQPATAPLTLRAAVELALANAPALAPARAGEREAAASSRLAADAFRPEALFTTTPRYGRGLPIDVDGHFPAIAGLELRQSLFDPERRWAAVEARVGEATARSGAERARAETARGAADLYLRCWADARLAAIALDRERPTAAAVARLEALRSEGRATDLDLRQARLRAARAKLRRLDAAAQRELDEMELRRLTGASAEGPLALAGDPLASLPAPSRGDDLPAARAADPELRATAQAIELLGPAAERRGAAFAPTLGAVAQYDRLSGANGVDDLFRNFRPDNWSVALSLALPLWNGGRAADARARAQATLDRLAGERRSRELELEMQVKRAESAVDRAEAALALARQAGELADESLRITGALAAEGRAEPEVMEGRESDRADAQEEIAKATAGLAVARANLLALRGELPGMVAATVARPAAAAPQ